MVSTPGVTAPPLAWELSWALLPPSYSIWLYSLRLPLKETDHFAARVPELHGGFLTVTDGSPWN